MALRCCASWIYLILFGIVSSSPETEANYVVHLGDLKFDDALQKCTPGVLTTLTTRQEAADVMKKISSMLRSEHKSFIFWVGLRLPRSECVVSDLPLKGFKWLQHDSQEAEFIHWNVEPEPTCMPRCVALAGDFDGSTVTRWGLISTTCKTNFPYICKQRDRQDKDELLIERGTVPTSPQPARQPEPKPSQDPGTTLGLNLGCPHPDIPGSRSFSLDPGNSSRITVKCYSGILLELWCSGHHAVWRRGDSPIDPDTVCQTCKDGYQKDAIGKCVDIDECSSSATCKHDCLNTEGSYRCICYDKHRKSHSEGSMACEDITRRDLNLTATPALTGALPWPTDNNHVDVPEDGHALLSGVLMPVLIGLLLLFMMVVVVAVVVKCCLKRHSKKRAVKKAHKMAMKSKQTGSKESFKIANEKEAT
ncbi:C-type lectin domain family 14 member A [Genypterus blacodes]|uniref:C-type lectin domain family 14 member A n=1 Tax=Genypterus blacodes TaxID=154954 RepID=UPI003F775959